MALLALIDGEHVRAEPKRRRGRCPTCDRIMIAKCGPIVIWHWAHETGTDCDHWAEPETDWHRQWKLYFAANHAARIEVPIGAHRADVLLPSGRIIELQSRYQSADLIAEREAFYGPALTWLYRCQWSDRLHYGRRDGFWWKRPAWSMATHRQTVLWDMSGVIYRANLSIVSNNRGGRRMLGRPLYRVALP
jgi:hypothetical protein